MYQSRLFQTGAAILMLFLIIYLGVQISFVFRPIVVIFETLFFSFLVAGILYYFTAPLTDLLTGRKVPRGLAIFVVFLVILALLFLLGLAVGPVFAAEVARLVDHLPQTVNQLQRSLLELIEQPWLVWFIDIESGEVEDLTGRISDLAVGSVTGLVAGLTGFIDFLGNLFTAVVVIPFLLFYMLKERGRGQLQIVVDRYAPASYRESLSGALGEINTTLAAYFQGIGLVCLCVGVMAFAGFQIIGLDYALMLAVFILITNVVPFIGPWIGAMPAAFVGLMDSPLTMVKVIIVIIIVQQIESFFITPQVMGRKVALSPLAIILVIIVAGRLAGLLGIIVAVPVFTVLKIVVNHIYVYIRGEEEPTGKTDATG